MDDDELLVDMLVGVEVAVDVGSGSDHEPVHPTGGAAVGITPATIAISAGSSPPMTPPKSRSHQSSPLLFLSPSGPVMFCGGELDAVGTATTIVKDGGAEKVMLATEVGGIILGSEKVILRGTEKKIARNNYSKLAL